MSAKQVIVRKTTVTKTRKFTPKKSKKGKGKSVFDLEERFSEEMEQEKAQISLSELWG